MQFTNLATSALVEQAILRQEGRLADNGSLLVDTGARTGRSPKDRFIVDDHTTHDVVDWGAVNQPVDPKVFDALWQKAGHYLAERDTFVSHFHVGDDPAHYRPLQLTSEFAWHTLFARNLFIRPDTFNPNNAPVWQMRNAARMVCDPKGDGVNSDAAVMLNFSERKVLICGTQYGGEMKKAMFTVLNFLLPEQRILPMHCGANIGQNGDTSLFFGLSGTGKTTLSADPDRYLIGDDEHGWADDRVFNLEGGCYAKCINLSQANEPVIWEAIRFGALVENVIMDEQTRAFDYNDASKTQNTRVAYPLEHIAMRSEHNRGDVPKAVIFLSCDLTGTLPPVAILSKEAAAYHFLSGYTALVGSTEVGSTAAIKPTFSACFGAPFFPRSPTVYAKLLMDKIDATGARVYLVNTGWTGGAYGTGKRFPIPVTRRVIAAIQNGELDNVSVRHLQPHNLAIPTHIAGIDDALLDPRSAYGNDAAYDKAAAELARAFANNIAKFADLPDSIKRAGPVIG